MLRRNCRISNCWEGLSSANRLRATHEHVNNINYWKEPRTSPNSVTFWSISNCCNKIRKPSLECYSLNLRYLGKEMIGFERLWIFSNSYKSVQWKFRSHQPPLPFSTLLLSAIKPLSLPLQYEELRKMHGNHMGSNLKHRNRTIVFFSFPFRMLKLPIRRKWAKTAELKG